MSNAFFITRYARIIGVLTALLVSVACVRPPQPVLVKPGSDATSNILVLKSSDNPVFDAPLDSFIADVESTVTVYSLTDELDAGALSEITARLDPDLIFTLGTKATLISQRQLPETPLLFAMVVNYKRHKLADQPNVMGIALETPPAVEFMMFKMVAADLKRVLTLYSPRESQDFVDEARESVAGMGVEIVAVPVENADQVEAAWAARPADIDGVWFMNDPVVMNPKTFVFLKDRTHEEGLLFFSSLSDRFAQSGALMSVSVDLTSLGSQAAAMARDLTGGSTPKVIGIQPPIGSKLVVNLDVAKQIGFVIPEEVLPFINEVIQNQAGQSPTP